MNRDDRNPALLQISRRCKWNSFNFCNMSRDLHLQYLRYLQHFACGDCPSHGKMAQTGASNPDGTDAIAANSATKPSRLPVEIRSACKDVSTNGSLAPVWNFTSGTKLPIAAAAICANCADSHSYHISHLSPHFSINYKLSTTNFSDPTQPYPTRTEGRS
ncbi:MAG: hypothetical protein JNM70_09530 [Anaerolineae bacterium]|nr:hypothetical protein [Anaerolineae bacterium]